MNEDSNMSIRRFLKHVGVTSQRVIEDALRDNDSAGKRYKVRVVLTIDELGVEHTVDGEVEGQG
ncbi:MAG: DUF6494 family protein [Burkholderiaceae bacterium]